MLSLPFILALVGAGVGLLVGILIFGQISEAISCPASGNLGTLQVSVFNVTSYDNLGTLGSGENAVYAESEVIVDFLNPLTGKINEAVKQEGLQSLGGALNGEIYLGSTPSDWRFLSGTGVGSDLVSIAIWEKGDLTGSAEYPIISNFHPDENGGYVAGSTDGIYIFTDSGRMKVDIENDNTRSLRPQFSATGGLKSEPPDDGQWHLLTFTYDKSIPAGSGNMEYCLDGTADNVTTTQTREGCYNSTTHPSFPCPGVQCFRNGGTGTTFTPAVNAPIDKLTIGSDGDHFQQTPSQVVENTFLVDDVGIWNGYRLTQSDVANIWNSGVGSAIDGSISPSTLKGYWSFDNATANGVTTPGGFVGGTEGGVGSEQCEQAKDTAWTVIGIMPVALFFGLFALFSSFQRPS